MPHKKKVLVIDDDELMLAALSSMLDRDNRFVYSTADGPRGIEICEAEKPDLVLLDIGLPTMNGLDVLVEVRRVHPTAKVIIVTGYASPQLEQEAMAKGAYAFFAKGSEIGGLLGAIQEALDEDAKKR